MPQQSVEPWRKPRHRGYHALVFGASGLAGWGVVDQLLENYPTEGTFAKVTALVNRPLSVASSYWPSPSHTRPKLSLVSGVNLTEGAVEEFSALLQRNVEDIASVTHVFYFGPCHPKATLLAQVELFRLTNVQPTNQSPTANWKSRSIVRCSSGPSAH